MKPEFRPEELRIVILEKTDFAKRVSTIRKKCEKNRMKAEQLNALNKDQIIGWLESALRGQAPLPRLTPDESHCAGIIRMEKVAQCGRPKVAEGRRPPPAPAVL